MVFSKTKVAVTIDAATMTTTIEIGSSELELVFAGVGEVVLTGLLVGDGGCSVGVDVSVGLGVTELVAEGLGVTGVAVVNGEVGEEVGVGVGLLVGEGVDVGVGVGVGGTGVGVGTVGGLGFAS